MRKLIFTDVFKFARILKKSNSKEAITEAVKTLEAAREEKKSATEAELKIIDEKTQEKIGAIIIDMALEGMATQGVEADIIELIASILEKEKSEVEQMAINEALDAIKKIASENNIGNFFNKALTLM